MLNRMQETALLRLRRRLLGYALALTRDMSAAEDLYQDTMLRAMTARAAPHDPVAYRVWVFRIMRNVWIDRLRADGRLPAFDDTVEMDNLPVSGCDEQVINALAVRQAFQDLSKAHRDILALVDICGFSYAETAEMLEVPVGTVMSRISRARAALAMRMREDDNIVPLPLGRRPRASGGLE